jgi:GGDEF domain-containing protein
VREYDSVGRVGADQFVIVLPETGGPDCQGVAGRIRNAACEAHTAISVSPLEVSVGIAEWNGTDSAAEFLEAAEQARRTAQRTGGDTAVWLSPRAPVDGLSALTDRLARAAGIAEKAALRARRLPGQSGDHP